MTSNSLSSNLLSVTDGHQLTQIISGPTRITNHCLLICASRHHRTLYLTLGLLHLPVAMMIHTRWVNCVDAPKNVTRMIRSFKRIDMEQLSEDLRQAPWSVMSCFDDINDMWGYWKGLFVNILDACPADQSANKETPARVDHQRNSLSYESKKLLPKQI